MGNLVLATVLPEDTMNIKKLSVVGFKSFMDRIEINFPSGISSFVGPNGCGKSNIVDAIRWCMGEQSPKQLRGRRMEDVIFNGAGDFKPLGMAEVSMVFENGDSPFSHPYAQTPELSITRRLYRSGESDYRINNVPCRLKDIQQIFMDTGLGNRAYSIIGQGEIGTILEQRPEDTRVMLEEASGITRYRKQVEESYRKIELTQVNLQRVEDVLSEIQKQMRSLKRQASKAKRYRSICEEIRTLEMVLYANSYAQFNAVCGEKVRSTEELSRQEVSKSTQLSQIQADIERLSLELQEKDSDLSRLRSNHGRAKESFHKKEGAVASLQNEMKMQDELKTKLEAEKASLETRLIEHREEKEAVSEKLEKTRSDLEELSQRVLQEEQRLKKRKNTLQSLREGYETARAEVNHGENKKLGLSHESDYLNRMLQQISDGRSRLEEELNEIKAKSDNIIKASERKSAARAATADKLEAVRASIQSKSRECEQLEEKKSALEQRLREADSNLNKCQSRLSSLQSLTENYEGYQVGVRTIMKAKQLEAHQQGRIFGLVADLIQVAPTYEQAVEAVLSDKLQYVIVESVEDARQAIDYLKHKGRGRSSFVSLRDMETVSAARSGNPQFPLLLELVSVPPNYRGLLEILLGNTKVVDDLHQAISAWRNNGRDTSFVTLEGDLVDQRGVISGGKVAQGTRGLLSRKREIGELEDQVAQSEKQVSHLEEEISGLDREIRESRDAIESLTEERWNTQEELNECDNQLFRLGQELDQLEKMSQRITEDINQKTVQQRKHERDLKDTDHELERCRAHQEQLHEFFQKKELELKESEAEFDQLREELSKTKSDHRILEEEQQSLTREIKRIKEYIEESETRRTEIAQDLQLGQQRREDYEKRIRALKSELEEIYHKLKAAEDEINQAERERQACQAEIKEEEGKAERLRGEIADLKDQINTVKMEHSEVKLKMDNLSSLVQEKYNSNLSEIYNHYLDENISHSEIKAKIEHNKNRREKLGEVNLTAIKEHEALKERHQFISNQREDLLRSIESLRTAIQRINKTSREKFMNTLQEVDSKLKEIFPILFNGGTAGLKLTDENNPLDSGVLVEVQPPGKRLSHMGLLSGGEKALVAMALLFAIYMIKPSPFCLLDEVDAPLDEANIDRFNNLLGEIKRTSQIIMVTHNRRTMEIVDRLYGVTMEKSGVSKTVSVDMENMKRRISSQPEPRVGEA